MTALGAALILLAAAVAAGLGGFFLWRPASGEIARRVDALIGRAGRDGGIKRDRAFRDRGLEFVKHIFLLGLPRTWGVHAGPIIFVLVALAAGAAAWFLCRFGLGLPPVAAAPLGAAGGWIAGHFLARAQQARAEQRFVDLLPDAIAMVVRMLRAGLPVSVTIRTVGKEAVSPVNHVFAALADQLEIGITFEDALGIAAERIGLPDFRFFAAAVALQHSTGGNLVATLEILAEIIRRRRVVRLKARAATAEVRLSAYVLGAIPLCVLGALVVLNPGYLTPLLSDPRGNFMLGVAFVMLLAAFVVMRQMMRGVIHHD
jgi:tight adherence protein B